MASIVPDRVDRQTTLNEALLKISEEIVVQRDLRSLFDSLARLLGQVLPFDLILFSVNDPDRQAIDVSLVENGRLFSLALPLDTEYQQWVSIPRIAEQRDFPSGL